MLLLSSEDSKISFAWYCFCFLILSKLISKWKHILLNSVKSNFWLMSVSSSSEDGNLRWLILPGIYIICDQILHDIAIFWSKYRYFIFSLTSKLSSDEDGKIKLVWYCYLLKIARLPMSDIVIWWRNKIILVRYSYLLKIIRLSLSDIVIFWR